MKYGFEIAQIFEGVAHALRVRDYTKAAFWVKLEKNENISGFF
jgi:hypothetical protein